LSKRFNFHYESEDTPDDLMKRFNKKIDDEISTDEYLAFTNPRMYMKKQYHKRKRREDGLH